MFCLFVKKEFVLIFLVNFEQDIILKIEQIVKLFQYIYSFLLTVI